MYIGGLTKIFYVAIGASIFMSATGNAADSATSTTDMLGEDSWAFKFTPSYYATTHQTDAVDLNLRSKEGPHALWLGYYRQGDEFEQARSGYEYTAQPLPWVQIVPSLQIATRGFFGGSINAQVGESIYGLLGFGRTNRRDYYNLNFDPNDSVLLGAGTTLLPKSSVSLFSVKDDRLHTEQVVNHLVWRLTPDENQRWTVDISKKRGRASADDEAVSGNGLSITYDYRDVFARLAWDKKVNFTMDNQMRMSLGFRF